jgi:uncharacterized protein YjiS (DUF1127 family)
MSTISSVSTAARSAKRQPWVIGLAASLKRWLVAYIAWRAQEAAIAELWSMSDRELADLGLTRSDISNAVKGGVTGDRPFRRYY